MLLKDGKQSEKMLKNVKIKKITANEFVIDILKPTRIVCTTLAAHS